MNEEIKQEIKQGVAQSKTETKAQNPQVTQTSDMQHVVEGMLPEKLRQNFENKKSGIVETAPNPTALDNLGRPISNGDKLDEHFVQKPIRTFESDLAEAMAQKQASAAQIAIAESKKREEQQRKVETDLQAKKQTRVKPADEPGKPYIKQLLLAILSLILISGGAIGGYYLYKQSAFAQPPVAPKPILVPSIITPDKQFSMKIDNTETSDALISQIYQRFNKETGDQNKIDELLLAEDNTDSNTNTKNPTIAVTASAFIQQANINMPDIIARSITDRWMLGTYTEDTGQKTLFVALSTDFFQNVFAGMLAWEKKMPDDLAVLFNYKQRIIQEENAIPLDTSTTTPRVPLSTYFSIQGSFVDKVLRNRDVREFRTPTGELLLLYSFIDKGTLIITTSESALIAIIDRVEKQTYVR